MMRKFLLLTLVLLLGVNTSFAATSVKSEAKEIKNVLKSQIDAANKYDYSGFIRHFDLQYVNSDGFNLDVYSKLVDDTWSSYNNIQYAQQVKNITIMGKDAIVEVVETANAQVESQYNLKGVLKSVANNIYFLKKTHDGWKIVSDIILTEDTCLSFGELTKHSPQLSVPYQTSANKNYTATLEFTAPKDTIAIASINQEKVTFPQETAKENYRKLPEDGILERFFTANGENTNEYIVASLGLTRPVFDNKDLQINITGVAYIIKRVNVVPENKFINRDGVISVSERLEKIKASETVADVENEPAQKEIKKSKKEEKNVSAEVVSEQEKAKKEKAEKPKREKIKKEKAVVETSAVVEDSVPATQKEKASKVKKEKPTKEAKVKTEKTPKVKQEKPVKEEKNKEQKAPKVKKEKPVKEVKEKTMKGVFTPAPVGIPTSAVVCPIAEPISAPSVDSVEETETPAKAELVVSEQQEKKQISEVIEEKADVEE